MSIQSDRFVPGAMVEGQHSADLGGVYSFSSVGGGDSYTDPRGEKVASIARQIQSKRSSCPAPDSSAFYTVETPSPISQGDSHSPPPFSPESQYTGGSRQGPSQPAQESQHTGSRQVAPYNERQLRAAGVSQREIDKLMGRAACGEQYAPAVLDKGKSLAWEIKKETAIYKLNDFSASNERYYRKRMRELAR